ncbi:MAG: hypothetical protein LZ169_03125 [Thaumarchaeota archaeon]|jgi:hypothetical protein|nr:hypothetical protein [Candidatus Wolframiiraptor allenii]
MPRSRLKIEFYGDRGTSEQILMISFRDGGRCQIFHGGGVREGDRRVTRCDMVRIMGWDQLIEYLGDDAFEKGQPPSGVHWHLG